MCKFASLRQRARKWIPLQEKRWLHVAGKVNTCLTIDIVKNLSNSKWSSLNLIALLLSKTIDGYPGTLKILILQWACWQVLLLACPRRTFDRFQNLMVSLTRALSVDQAMMRRCYLGGVFWAVKGIWEISWLNRPGLPLQWSALVRQYQHY